MNILFFLLGVGVTTLFFFWLIGHVYKTHFVGTINLGIDAIETGTINMKLHNLPESTSGNFVILELTQKKSSP